MGVAMFSDEYPKWDVFSPDGKGERDGPAWEVMSLLWWCNKFEGAAVLLGCP